MRVSMRTNAIDSQVTILEGSVLESNLPSLRQFIMEDLLNVIPFLESRFAAMETHFGGTNWTDYDHWSMVILQTILVDLKKMLLDPNIHGGHWFQRQDSSF